MSPLLVGNSVAVDALSHLWQGYLDVHVPCIHSDEQAMSKARTTQSAKCDLPLPPYCHNHASTTDPALCRTTLQKLVADGLSRQNQPVNTERSIHPTVLRVWARRFHPLGTIPQIMC